ADELLATLRARPMGLTRTEISTAVFGHNRASGDIGRALSTLSALGLIHVRRVETAGRPAERWHAALDTKETNEGQDDHTDISSNSFISSPSADGAGQPALEEGTWVG